MPEIRNVAILGAGALGAYYASRFFANGFATTLVAGGERAARLREEGLTVNGEHLLLPVSDPDRGSAPADLILVALKHHHLKGALPNLAPLVGPETILLSVMNGLDSEAVIGESYGLEKLLYCVAVGIDGVREGNAITVAHAGRLWFGEARNTTLSQRVRRVQAALARAGLSYETPADMTRTLWWKFMVNVGINQASAMLRAPYGVFQRSADARAVCEVLMREVIALATGARVDLTEKDLKAWDGTLSGLAPQGKTSMLQDLEAGRQTEVEIFAGKAVALGAQYDIPTPANALTLHIIRTLENAPGTAVS